MASFEDALLGLQSARFEEAKSIFAELLQSDPDNAEYQSGFYASGYWANRAEMARGSESPRPGTGLMEQWDGFQEIAEKKGFASTRSLKSAMKAVLGRAAEQYRQKFQREGMAHPDLSERDTTGGKR